ncbi:GNAT family N-acetyltransferase [Paracoccus denitrificans]|uniref:GNAT family N-acetyltransferase n=1 Tax=Paracoccus denitrificans TaxID=266 RepID=UPI001E4DE875|nr:GNAT family N-acetyltransferase [Paracoccus denitrificans]UFS64546.1 GNAT family N-acetyltransferase [Paracoccus denitrificans]
MDQSLPRWRNPAPLQEKLHEALAAYDGDMPQDHLLLVCEDERGWIAGFAHAGMDADFFSGEAQAHLYYLVTDPSCEGKGVGRMLMDAVEEFARAKYPVAEILKPAPRSQRPGIRAATCRESQSHKSDLRT